MTLRPLLSRAAPWGIATALVGAIVVTAALTAALPRDYFANAGAAAMTQESGLPAPAPSPHPTAVPSPESGVSAAPHPSVSAANGGRNGTDASARVTFNRDIAPIMFRSCAMCHRPGEAGPFPLLTYSDAKSHARQIAAVTRTRYMPPWLPEPGALKFSGDLRLSTDQIALIKKWVDQGAPEGSAKDLPPQPRFAQGWQLGKPDLIVKAARPFTLAASGIDTYWNFVFRTPVRETRWVKAIEIRPGEKRVIHHANILVDRTQSARADEKEPGAGFPGMELKIESEAFDPDSHFLFWKPGTIAAPEPPGMALRLDADTDLVLNVHLQPSGKPEEIQPALGIYFTDQPATLHPMLLQLENDRALDIPPGNKNFVVTDQFTLPLDVQLLQIYPHAHYLGKDILATATLPSGETETLVHIPHWDLNWQAVYRYESPVRLPRGTKITMRYSYDNSGENPYNPHMPPQRVQAGNRSSDEMAHLWLQVLPRNPTEAGVDSRVILQEALARHHVENDPADFAAHYNLGAILEARGDTQGAIAEFERGLQIQPDDATARNALGAALLAARNVDQAIAQLGAALQARPAYFDAQYNLGNALASKGDFGDAIGHFRAAVQLKPDDANAEANLGSALAETGNLSEAKLHYERALQIDPQNALARENLQEVNREIGERKP